MDLLTPELLRSLIANVAAREAAARAGADEPDPAPVVKFFNPCGAATWLLTEIERDGDTLFGLCDLGVGCPELGSVSLAEIAAVRVRFGLGIKRDPHFAASHPLSVYAQAAQVHGGIVEDAAALAEAALWLATERDMLPPSSP